MVLSAWSASEPTLPITLHVDICWFRHIERKRKSGEGGEGRKIEGEEGEGCKIQVALLVPGA